MRGEGSRKSGFGGCVRNAPSVVRPVGTHSLSDMGSVEEEGVEDA